MAVMIGNASIDENGNARGGAAGDQTGKEVWVREWNDAGWDQLVRAKEPDLADQIAFNMECACENDNIGYDQGQRITLYDAAKRVNFNLSKISTPCECDCSSLVAVCVIASGVYVNPDLYTGNEAAALVQTGKFDLLKDEKYMRSPDYLKRGDILIHQYHHTAIVLTNGEKADDNEPIATGYAGYYTVTTRLNMRSGAGVQNKIITVLPQGAVVVCYGGYENVGSDIWLEVVYQGITGWCNMAYLKFAGTIPEEKPVQEGSEGCEHYEADLAGHYMTTTALNMRRGAGTGYRVVKVLPARATVRCYGYYSMYRNTRWLYVQYEGKNGYASQNYLIRG